MDQRFEMRMYFINSVDWFQKEETGAVENYYMLAHDLPEDQNLRERLQQEKLVDMKQIGIKRK